MRLTLIAAIVSSVLVGGCANNVSDSHAAPVLVSTNPKKPPSVAKAPASPLVATSTVDASVQSIASDKKSTSLGLPPEPVAATTIAEDDIFSASSASSGVVTASAPAKAPTPPAAPLPNLSKQVTPQFPFLRVSKISSRLSFNEKTQEFTFQVRGGSLKQNVSDLLDMTVAGQLEYQISPNHAFPNAFEIKGKTVAHLIDQMVAPFKQPSQVLQDVFVNNLVLIQYSRGVSTNEK